MSAVCSINIAVPKIAFFSVASYCSLSNMVTVKRKYVAELTRFISTLPATLAPEPFVLGISNPRPVSGKVCINHQQATFFRETVTT
jgi:hypothetical protein